MIKLQVGSTMGFSGGAEATPIVTIGYKEGELAFLFNVDGESSVSLTEAELLALIEWANGKVVGSTGTLPFGICTVRRFEEAGSLNYGSAQVRIAQNGQALRISTPTLASVLEWGRKEKPWQQEGDAS